MVNITINGTSYEVPEGYTVLKAATEKGIHIPTLCDHPELTPYGGCRLCLVEVDGFRTPQPSCTLPVSNNMVIRTDTPAIHESRKFVLSLIFSERNHFCPYCQVSGGDCELQNSAYDEGMTYWPIQPNWKNYPVDASHPYIILEHNRCILCRRCVRACGELVGNFTLGVEERGANSILMADLGVPLGESTCVSCGTCVQVCPTGALIDRWSAYRGREEESKSQKTICTACSVGCGIEVFTRHNNIVKIYGDWDSAINKGVICEKGRFLPMVEKRERVLTPIVKMDGKPKAATWQNALEAVAAKWSKGEVAALVSDRLPAETLSLVSDLVGQDKVSVIESAGDATRGLKKPFEGKLADLKKS
ncbi:MAG TPA: 2Fe-2S iron-sulfur cluster-binding protein, partial [Anaerolineaceae bacterium]|nr:2Fe-2S iron-sulfur cluster-binding protein [Anaerolineaceae bacterium]